MSFDESRWPVVVVTLPSDGPVELIHDWYDYVEAMLTRADRPLAIIHDLRALHLGSGGSAHRRAVAARTVRLRDMGFHKMVAADARVVEHEVLATFLTIVDWLTGDRPWPQRTFVDFDEAMAWGAELAAAAKREADIA